MDGQGHAKTVHVEALMADGQSDVSFLQYIGDLKNVVWLHENVLHAWTLRDHFFHAKSRFGK